MKSIKYSHYDQRAYLQTKTIKHQIIKPYPDLQYDKYWHVYCIFRREEFLQSRKSHSIVQRSRIIVGSISIFKLT